MTSRLRGPSAVKDTPRAATSFAKDHSHRSEPEVHSGQSCKNGGHGNRYHFGMSKQHDKVERNGQEYNKNFAQTEENNADLLYKKNRKYFGSWDMDDTGKSRRQDFEDTQLTNGKFRSEPVGAKLDKSHDRPEYRDEGYVGSLPREGRQRGESIERELNGSHKSRIKESWEEEVESRNRGRIRSNDSNNDLMQPIDERDILLKEIENLATDGSQSPDRRIQAMIERLKSREESKLRSRRDQRLVSSEKEAHGTTKSDGKSDLRSPIIDHPLDNLSNDRGKKLKDDREDEPRRSSDSKLRGKFDREEEAGRRDRSTDRKSRSTERRNETREPRRDDSFRKTSGTYNAERNYQRRSIEDEEHHPRSRDNSSKRRSYTYEGSPEDFEVRIQRYDRALLEPRRDLDKNSPRRSSPRRSSSREPNVIRKESLKEHDREPIIKKNSFKAESKRATSKDRGESNLIRKTSFKDRDNDAYKRHVSKNQHETSIRYFGKDQEDLLCKDSFKDVNTDINRKDFFKVRDSEFDRTFLKDQNDNAERKVSSMEHAGGVSRIVLRNVDDESSRNNSFKNTNEDSGKKNSFKEKNVEFDEISYKNHESNSEKRKNNFKDDDKEFERTLYHDYENNIDRKIANERYIEFGKVSFKTPDDELRISSPFKEEDNEAIVRTSSFKEHDTSSKRHASLRSRDRELFERKLDRHSKALTPPKKDEAENNAKDSKNFCTKSWYENNRMFSAKYLQNHSKLRSAAEGRLDVDVSPERGFSILQDAQGSTVETSTNDPEENRFEPRGRINSGDSESPRFSSTRDRNGTTIIRIRSSEDSGSAAERRRRRRPAQEVCAVRRRKYEDDDEDSDEDEGDDRWRRTRRDGGILPGRGSGDAGGATPSRTVWNYREGGVLITDVEEGQPCLQCGETCSGFSPHTWRNHDVDCRVGTLNERLQRRHTTPTLLSGSNSGPTRMSPKGPASQEGPKMEVRVSCVPTPGAEPQGVRVRIPEPKKRPMSPPLLETTATRTRCPSVPEKDFYRKTSSLERRDRYPTLSGAEIKRGLISNSAEPLTRRRNPMLDRRSRYPTITGAELRRSMAIGKCPLEDGLDLSLAPWPGMKWACVRVLHLYCKVFDQFELFELIVRKNCTSCKCPREAHDVCHEEWVSVRSRLGLKGDESNGPIGVDPRERGLAWAPPGLPSHKVEEYFSMLPEIAVPRLGTPGERHRDRQLAIQLPKQDLARAYCRHLDPKHASSADDFMAARNEIALDIGSVQEVLERDLECGVCESSLKYGSLAVSASKLGLLYHPTCFRCTDCKELLVDLAYCVHDDMLFCERHYAEQLKPRCAACDELIFSGEYTKAMNKDWHSGHFCCWQCDESLTGQRYVLRDEHPYCIKCYESVFANGCEECNKIIGIDSKDLSYKDKHWHEACFLCNRCRVSLVDKQFGSKVDKIYCGNCYDSQFASRCDGCGEIFRAGTKKMEYKTRQWHEKCFCCVVCKNPIGTKSFIPREQEIYCAGCYEDKFATRCVKCNKIITSGGVTYKNEPWHRDCFTCSNCNNSLAGQRFTSRDDKPYCADCFGELFAKRCTACSKPITGIGGTRFISFEDRHWHNDCFICAGCKTSLVGRGFITDGDDIICPECAKMKLM